MCKRSRRCVGCEGVRIWRSTGYGGLVGVRLRELGVWGLEVPEGVGFRECGRFKGGSRGDGGV